MRAREQKVCFAVCHCEAQRAKGLRRLVPHGGYLRAAAREVGCVGQRGLARQKRQAVDIIGVEAEFDGVQVRDERRAAHGITQPRAREASAFGKGAHHQQIVVPAQQAGGTLSAEIHIGLVHHHQAVRVLPKERLDLRQRQAQARGRVGVCQEHRARHTRIIACIHRKILPERHLLRRDAEQLREHRVKAVGDVCECRALFAKREECKRQNLVRAVAREHLVPAHAERLCQRGQKIRARGVRIQAQVFRRAAVQRLQYLRAGRVRVFIRVQFDKGFHAPRLLPGRIGRNGAQRARQKTAHAFLCLPAPKIIFPARRGNRPGIGHRFVFRQALLYAAAPEE